MCERATCNDEVLPWLISKADWIQRRCCVSGGSLFGWGCWIVEVYRLRLEVVVVLNANGRVVTFEVLKHELELFDTSVLLVCTRPARLFWVN